MFGEARRQSPAPEPLSLIDCLLNFDSRVNRVLVLPNPHNDPSIRLQRPGNLFISFTISSELWDPVACIRFGNRPMDGAAMPEAPIDKNCHPDSTEDKVWTNPNAPRSNWKIPAITKPTAVENRT